MIEVVLVDNKKLLKEFVAFPDKLYKGNKYRVPQLHTFENSTLAKDKNPAFEHCDAKYWLAYKEGKIVGRIAGIINHKANEIWNENRVRFGWIDFIDDLEVSSILLKTVEDWGLSMGVKEIHGPMGFSDMDLEGMLVEGYEELGTQAVIYNYPYYPEHLEKHKFSKDVDWVQFEIKIPDAMHEKLARVSSIVKRKYGLKAFSPKKSKDLLPYTKDMFEVLNEGYKNLYGFVPLTEKQIQHYTDQYFSMINPKYVCFIIDEETDKVVGFAVAVLSLSKAMIKAKGKLYPFGFVNIIKDLYKNDTADLLLQAVLPQYQNKGVAGIFFESFLQAFIDNGIKTVVSSHALENNTASFATYKNYEHRQHIRRRCYKKFLP